MDPHLLTGGGMAERLLRNRGRPRDALAAYLVRKLDHRLAAFLKGDWIPQVGQKVSEIPISLTSWRPRLPQLPLVLLTLLQQTLRPKEILVWLKEADRRALETEVANRFQGFGVRFETCEDIKPHTKWLPMIERGFHDPFVICDDDIFYPSTWFAALISEDRPDAYVGVRCHRLAVMADGAIAPYSAWTKTIRSNGQPDHSVFVTGCGGAVVRPDRIPKAFLDRNAIIQTCLTADDIWLKVAHLAAKVPCFKTRYSFPCLEFPGAADCGLAQANVDGDGNDRQLAAALEYSGIDVSALLR